jgi:hypothetical protein
MFGEVLQDQPVDWREFHAFKSFLCSRNQAENQCSANTSDIYMHDQRKRLAPGNLFDPRPRSSQNLISATSAFFLYHEPKCTLQGKTSTQLHRLDWVIYTQQSQIRQTPCSVLICVFDWRMLMKMTQSGHPAHDEHGILLSHDLTAFQVARKACPKASIPWTLTSTSANSLSLWDFSLRGE